MGTEKVTFDGDALATSKYFKRFQKLDQYYETGVTDPTGCVKEVLKEEPTMVLTGDMILVEKLPKVEKMVKCGGMDLIIADVKTHAHTYADEAAEFGIVLMTGPGQTFEDGTVVPTFTKPGDVVLLTGRVDWYSQFGHLKGYEPHTIGRVRDSDLFMFFNDYKKAMEILNEEDKSNNNL